MKQLTQKEKYLIAGIIRGKISPKPIDSRKLQKVFVGMEREEKNGKDILDMKRNDLMKALVTYSRA